MITTINEFKRYLIGLQRINDAVLSTHFVEQFMLRAVNTLAIKESVGNKEDVLIRVKLLLEKFKRDLEKFPTTAEKKLMLVDFGDIMLKNKDGKITKPLFTCNKNDKGTKKYEGSVFCVPVYGNDVATILLFDREVSVEDKIKQLQDHILNNTNEFPHGVDQFSEIVHVYLNKLPNGNPKRFTVIDLNDSMAIYVDKLLDKQPIAITSNTTIDDLEYEVKADYQKETPHRQGSFNYKKGSVKAETYGAGVIMQSIRGNAGNWYDVVVKFQNPEKSVITFTRLLARDFFKVAA